MLRVMNADEAAADRLRTALELVDLAERMLRAKLRRDHPRMSAAEIERRIDDWYLRRPGAEHGDAVGRRG
jgi:hypothetical protein